MATRLRRWTLTLSAGEILEFSAADWDDALVVVERGELELECLSGRRAAFPVGAVLTFAGVPVRRLRSRGPEPLVLSAVTRP